MALSLEQLSRKASPKPPKVAIYGPGGSGKTTLASEFPSPFFLMTEDGAGVLDITTFSDEAGRPKLMTTFGEVMDGLEVLAEGGHEFRTLVVDSVTRMEPLVWAEAVTRLGWTDIERDGDGKTGFGKGYVMANQIWREFLRACTFLRDRLDMAIVLIGHEIVTKFDDPSSDSYDRYSMRLHKGAEALIREDVDVLGFINQITMIQKEKAGFKETVKARGSGQRAIHVEPRPAFQAKNRYGMPGQILINPGEGFAALAAYLPPIGGPTAAKAA